MTALTDRIAEVVHQDFHGCYVTKDLAARIAEQIAEFTILDRGDCVNCCACKLSGPSTHGCCLHDEDDE